MAYANSDVDDFVTCGVCFNEYDTKDKNPKILQCSHTICLQCLKQICKDGSITCPFCRDVSVKDISDVPNNSYVLQMMKQKEKKQISKPIANLLVRVWCLDCDSAEKPNCVSLGHSTVKMTTDKHPDSIVRNMKVLANLKEELMEMNEQKTDKLVEAIGKRKQVQERLSDILKSIKKAEERIERIKTENDLQLTKMVSILDRNNNGLDISSAGPSEPKRMKDFSLSDLIKLVENSSSDDTAEMLKLKMAKSFQLSEEKLSEATALQSEYDFEDKSKLIVQLIDAENRPIPWTCKWLGGFNSETKQTNHIFCNFTKLQGNSDIVKPEMKLAREKKLFELVLETRPNVKEIQDLIKSGVDINCRNEKGATPFMKLVKVSKGTENLEEIVLFFLQNGADVNAKKNNGSTALHVACKYYDSIENLLKIIRLLMENGANINEKEVTHGWTPLHYLCLNYPSDNLRGIISLLIENGADVKKKTKYGSTALDIVKKWYPYYNENKNEIKKLLGG